jgi:hypothetical protein
MVIIFNSSYSYENRCHSELVEGSYFDPSVNSGQAKLSMTIHFHADALSLQGHENSRVDGNPDTVPSLIGKLWSEALLIHDKKG